jgi:predicted DNA-binding protein (UPF0251 family)
MEARRIGLPISIQDYVILSLDDFDVATLRPDIARQAREWVAQHERVPRDFRSSHIQTKSLVRLPPPAHQRYRQAQPVTLEREALVTRLIEVERLQFKQVATQLGVTREIVRQIYARACRRGRFCSATNLRTTLDNSPTN